MQFVGGLIATMRGSRTPWGGEKTVLLRKTCLVPESPEHLPVYTLTFATPPAYGEWTGCRIGTGDVIKVCVPGYKPKSYSMSAERPGEFDITFKVYPNGRASGYLNSIKIGEDIDTFPLGKKRRFPGSHVGLVAFGVGITEALPIAIEELGQTDAKHVCLLWASKTTGDTFWHEQIARLKEEHGDRFVFAEILSREQKDGAMHGRINADVLAQVFDGTWLTGPGAENERDRDGVRFLTVGTKSMMKEADQMLQSIGYDMEFGHGANRLLK